ncbi:MAG: Rne/Rng family ribonuclease, partial [Desulfuromonadales bacterium]|nr:Rne/Rng family ribonuclease [Desulfuromonadales bacterium]
MSKKMLINASHPEENRVAIVVDGILSELDIEIAGQEQAKGNIYKAVVIRVETGLQAAFVDYGAEKLGFLQISEIHPNLYPPKDENKGRPRINDILHRGQEILIQIVKEERGSKGAALTTLLSIPGRYMVLMPDSTTKGVSRKISADADRKKLKKTMAELDLPEQMGYIVRTAGIGKEKEELKRDFDYLVRLFEGIVSRKDQIKAPAQLYQESNLAIRSIRDYFNTDMDEVLIDDTKIYQDAKDFFALVMPEHVNLVKQHRERRPIFSRYQIEEQIDALSKNQIALPSGGSIVIDQTEALVAIDVNSGKMSSESGIEATAAKTNLEAAAEIGRQLRLRDLGGLIVIDFIDMRDRKHIREVEQELRKALKDDKAKVSVGRISQFGLMEMSRQRLKPTLSVGAYLECPHCRGKGRIKSAEAQAIAFLRQAHAAASKGHIGHIEASVPLNVANYLLNQKRSALSELEQQLNLRVTVVGHSDFIPDQLELETHKREKPVDNNREILPVSHANQIESALTAQQEADSLQTDEQEKKDEVGSNQDKGEESPEKTTRKKRRRRRRKTPSTSSNNAETTPTSAAETEELPTITEKTVAVTELPTEETPKPRRPRRSKSKKPVADSLASTDSDTPEDTRAEMAEAEQPPASEEKPKRRTRRT